MYGWGGGLDYLRVKMILPALTEATSPFFRPIKYSLFPPLGLMFMDALLRGEDRPPSGFGPPIFLSTD